MTTGAEGRDDSAAIRRRHAPQRRRGGTGATRTGSTAWRCGAAIVFAAVLVAGCGGGDGGAACTSGLRVGVGYDVGGIGDKSFNDSAHRGLLRAIADGLVDAACVTTNRVAPSGADRAANVRALARHSDLVVGVGFSFSDDVTAAARAQPQADFMVVDGAAGGPNVADYTFQENEGSFLVGAAAALTCGCDTVGFLGGQAVPLIARFQAGYAAGARAVNPAITVLVRYIGADVSAFNDPDAAEALADEMYDAGAGVVFHAAGASGTGLFRAAAARARWSIGVDSDQYLTAPAAQQPWILTSMLKRVDIAVYEAIRAAQAGTFSAGHRVFGLAEDGVGFATSNPALTPAVVAALDDYRRRIVAGEIVVPTVP